MIFKSQHFINIFLSDVPVLKESNPSKRLMTFSGEPWGALADNKRADGAHLVVGLVPLAAGVTTAGN